MTFLDIEFSRQITTRISEEMNNISKYNGNRINGTLTFDIF